MSERNIKHMWNCPMPKRGVEAAGFPVLANTVSTRIFIPTRETGGYNHHPKINVINGHFYAIWSNHPHGEDGPGQRILFSHSANGRDWSNPGEFLAPIADVKPSEEKGLVLTAFDIVEMDESVYAIIGCHANIGFCNWNETKFSDVRIPGEFPSRARKGYSILAKEIKSDFSFGPVFALVNDIPEETNYDVIKPDAMPVAQKLYDFLKQPLNIPNWDFRQEFGFPISTDGNRLCEPVTYRTSDGKVAMLLRDTHYTHRMFFSTWNDDLQKWNDGCPTDIPDSPSLAATVTLEDGKTLLIGNQVADDFDNENVTHYPRNPLTVSVSEDGYIYNKVFALRNGLEDFIVPDVKGRGKGFQYPSAIAVDGKLYVLYSINKEQIEITEISLNEIIG